MNARTAFAQSRTVRLTVDDYLLLDRHGAFASYGKTELIDGVVLAMNAQFSEHYMVKNRLYRRIADACDALGRGLEAWSEGSIRLGPHAAPEPDIFVTDGTPPPGITPCGIVRLVVEVASTTLDDDLGVMMQLYATAGIAEYWVVDVNARVIHQMWSPDRDAYAGCRKIEADCVIEVATIPKLVVQTDGIWL